MKKPIYESMKASFDRDIYRLNTNMIAGPTATMWADSDFLNVVAQKRPQSVFFKIDADLNVLGNDGKAFASLYDCLSATSSFIPRASIPSSFVIRILIASPRC